MSVCDTGIKLTSVALNGNSYGTPIAVEEEMTLDDIVIPAAGQIGPSCVGLVRGDLQALVSFLEKGHQARTVIGTLLSSFADGDGDAQNSTLATMIARGVAWRADRNAPPFTWIQRARHKGDMSSDPMS